MILKQFSSLKDSVILQNFAIVNQVLYQEDIIRYLSYHLLVKHLNTENICLAYVSDQHCAKLQCERDIYSKQKRFISVSKVDIYI